MREGTWGSIGEAQEGEGSGRKRGEVPRGFNFPFLLGRGRKKAKKNCPILNRGEGGEEGGKGEERGRKMNLGDSLVSSFAHYVTRRKRKRGGGEKDFREGIAFSEEVERKRGGKRGKRGVEHHRHSVYSFSLQSPTRGREKDQGSDVPREGGRRGGGG